MEIRPLARALGVLVALSAAGCAVEGAEGRPWIRSLTMRGVRHPDASDLRAKIALRATTKLWWLPYAPRHYLDPFAVDLDRRRIEAWYQAHGYFDARVTAADVTRRDDESVDVSFTVEEGAPTLVRTVVIASRAPLTPAEIEGLGHLHLHRGHDFDYAELEEQKEAMKLRLQRLGYAWAEVAARARVDRRRHVADLALSLTPGPHVRFAALAVRGADGLVPEVIRRAGIDAGDPFDPDDLEDARGRLENLRLFSSVVTDVERDPGDPTRAIPVLRLNPAPRRELRLGGGVGLDPQRYDAHLTFSHLWRSFLGGFRTLRLRVEPGYVLFSDLQRNGPIATVELQLVQPDVPFRLSRIVATVGLDLGQEYAFSYVGPRAQLGLSQTLWRDRVRVGASYNFQLLDFFGADPTLALTDPAQAGRLYGYVNPYRVAWLEEDIVLDLRDRPLEATRGAFFSLTVEEGGSYAGSAFDYQKIQPEVRAYVPLWPRAALAGRAQYGVIFSQGQDGSPITRRFYLGGPSSHRGFGYHRLSQQVPSGRSGVPPLPIGGDQMLLVQVELRADVIPLGGASWIGLVAFLDGGEVSEPACGGCALPPGHSDAPATLDLDRLHWAAGGGLRLRTPVGTLRFDLGVRLNRLEAPNPDPGERFAWHLSIGEAF